MEHYEYAAFKDGDIVIIDPTNEQNAKELAEWYATWDVPNLTIRRRPVGEWEDLND